MLDDGTAVGRVVLAGAASDWVGLVEPGDAINATGRVATQEDGELALVVTDPAALALGSGLDGLAAGAEPDLSPAPTLESQTDVQTAGIADPGGLVPGAGAGLVGILMVGLASVAMTVIRRRHGRRLLAERVATRLAGLTGPRRVRKGRAQCPRSGSDTGTDLGPRVAGWPSCGRRQHAVRAPRMQKTCVGVLDARRIAGLSSPEFRASEAGT